MKLVYRVLAYLISLAVVLQAAAIALGFFGLGNWIESGGTLTKAGLDSGTTHFPGDVGLAIHGTVGMMVIPIIGLLLVISSFFTGTRRAIWWSLIVLGCIVVQVLLGLLSHQAYALGAVHGIFAFAVMGTAAYAGRMVIRPAGARSEPERAAAPVAR
jgi:hypothetical protein